MIQKFLNETATPHRSFVRIVKELVRPKDSTFDFKNFFKSGEYKKWEKKVGTPFRTNCNVRKSHFNISLKALNGSVIIFHDFTTLVQLGHDPKEIIAKR